MLEQFQSVGSDLFLSHLVDSHGGNMSVREGDKLFITRRGCMLGHIIESDIIEVPIEGEVNSFASKDLLVHRAIYATTSAKSIIHAHGPYSVALSITENKVITQDSEGLFYFNQGIPIIKTRTSIGSDEVAKMLPGMFNNGYSIVLSKGHGSFAIGDTLEKCLLYTSILENSCKILAISRICGQKPPPQQQQTGREYHQRKSAIPPGLGVMDRTAFRRSRAFKSQPR